MGRQRDGTAAEWGRRRVYGKGCSHGSGLGSNEPGIGLKPLQASLWRSTSSNKALPPMSPEPAQTVLPAAEQPFKA